MTCPGLHCPGCSGGQSLGILGGGIALLAIAGQTVQWAAERIWWIGGTLAASFAVAVAVSAALEAWSDRRAARYAAGHGIVSRADVLRLPRGVPATPVTSAPRRELPAATHVHLHFDRAGTAEAATIIRTALPRQAGDAITEGN